jgi:hypothetical protein
MGNWLLTLSSVSNLIRRVCSCYISQEIPVGLVALPLAMALAIASGVPPSRGSKLAIDITGLKLLNGQRLPLRGYFLRSGGVGNAPRAEDMTFIP